jgi:hypothetical protein
MQIQAFYTIAELARLAGMTRQTMGRLLLANGLAMQRVGRTAIVPMSEVERKLPLVWESLLALERLRTSVARDAAATETSIRRPSGPSRPREPQG